MSFNQSEYLLVKILEDLTVMGKPVDVLTEFPPRETLPAVTMSNNGGKGHKETLVFKNMNILPIDHPCFDPQAPKTIYHTHNRIEDIFHNKMLLHIWSESNEKRDMILALVIEKILENKNNNFGKDICVQLINIGSTSNADQYDSYPPLYHSIIELDFLYKIIIFIPFFITFFVFSIMFV